MTPKTLCDCGECARCKKREYMRAWRRGEKKHVIELWDTNERWLPVVGYEGRYDVSDRGRVRSYWHGNSWWPTPQNVVSMHQEDRSGYQCVLLRSAGVSRGVRVHRLVLESFVGLRPVGQVGRHLNGDPSDNRLENLCWGTPQENADDTIRHGRSPRGRRHFNARLTEDDVRTIRARRAKGEYAATIAADYDISAEHVCGIANGKVWRWL